MKKENVLVSTLLAVCLVAGLTLTGCGFMQKEAGAQEPSSASKSYTFRLADTLDADHPTVAGDKKFAQLVNERTNGRIKINVFPGSQLGEEKAAIEQAQLGAIDFVRAGAGALAGFNKRFQVFSLPYIFDSDAHLWRFLKGEAGSKLLGSLAKTRMIGLAYYESGARNFYSRKPITGIADLKGQKFRVIQNKVNMDIMKALGASATPMAYGEVFSALQTGIIDGAENNYPNLITSNHYQQAKHLIIDEHQRVPEVLIMSKVTWDKLPEADRAIIQQAALDSVVAQRELFDTFEKAAEEKIKAAGVTVTDVADVAPWREAVKPVIEKYRMEFEEQLMSVEKARY